MKHILENYDVALVGPEAEVTRYRTDVAKARIAINHAVALLEASFARGLDETEESRLVSLAYDSLKATQLEGPAQPTEKK